MRCQHRDGLTSSTSSGFARRHGSSSTTDRDLRPRFLISEAARGAEGGVLRNRGRAVHGTYAPASRTCTKRHGVPAIYTEIREGRGINGRDYVHLDLTHLGEKKLAERLSDITSFIKIYLGLNAATDLVPTAPTCHYMMGGIPANTNGQVLDIHNTPVPGLYAAGECSCLSLHGANRLGCNSLLDLVVFGRRAGQHIAGELKSLPWADPPPDAVRETAEGFGGE